jgi:hypothetical protein
VVVEAVGGGSTERQRGRLAFQRGSRLLRLFQPHVTVRMTTTWHYRFGLIRCNLTGVRLIYPAPFVSEYDFLAQMCSFHMLPTFWKEKCGGNHVPLTYKKRGVWNHGQ